MKEKELERLTKLKEIEKDLIFSRKIYELLKI